MELIFDVVQVVLNLAIIGAAGTEKVSASFCTVLLSRPGAVEGGADSPRQLNDQTGYLLTGEVPHTAHQG